MRDIVPTRRAEIGKAELAYFRMLVGLAHRTVIAKTESSSNVLFVALILPVAKPTARTRSPCAMNSRGSVDVSIDLAAVSSRYANPACPR